MVYVIGIEFKNKQRVNQGVISTLEGAKLAAPQLIEALTKMVPGFRPNSNPLAWTEGMKGGSWLSSTINKAGDKVFIEAYEVQEMK